MKNNHCKTNPVEKSQHSISGYSQRVIGAFPFWLSVIGRRVNIRCPGYVLPLAVLGCYPLLMSEMHRVIMASYHGYQWSSILKKEGMAETQDYVSVDNPASWPDPFNRTISAATTIGCKHATATHPQSRSDHH